MKRSKKHNHIRILVEGKEKVIESSILYNKIGIHRFIRIPADEFTIWDKQQFLDHFNLEHHNHSIWRKYGIIKIVESWRYNPETDEEKLPLLDIETLRVWELIDSKEYISYSAVTDDMLTYSFPHIKSIDELKQAILKRYSTSLLWLTKEDILAKWVARNRLSFIS